MIQTCRFLILFSLFTSYAVAGESRSITIAALLSDDARVSADSEFSIGFPLENHPARTIVARSAKGKATAEMHSTKKTIKSSTLSTQDYKEFVGRIRDLDEKEFQEVPAECQEPYVFRLRVGDRQRLFSGCRGQGSNASAISKLARDVEFRLIQSATSDKSR